MTNFEWKDPGELMDKNLTLVLVEKSPAETHVLAYKFEMCRVGSAVKIGNIDLRVGETYRLPRELFHITLIKK